MSTEAQAQTEAVDEATVWPPADLDEETVRPGTCHTTLSLSRRMKLR